MSTKPIAQAAAGTQNAPQPVNPAPAESGQINGATSAAQRGLQDLQKPANRRFKKITYNVAREPEAAKPEQSADRRFLRLKNPASVRECQRRDDSAHDRLKAMTDALPRGGTIDVATLLELLAPRSPT
jgi:hypothetical protein